jgi:hypothetical protein
MLFGFRFFSEAETGDKQQCCLCIQGLPGPPGFPGTAGQPGNDGRPGHNGLNGRDMPEAHQPSAADFCFSCPDGLPGGRGVAGFMRE